MPIPQETIDHVRQAADIVDVVSERVQLKRRGRNLFGLCPFHTEKTPSFSVAPDKQIFHCFGCGAGGNVFTFVMEYEKVDFVEAVRRLGIKCGIEVSVVSGQNKELFTRLLELHVAAAELYRSNLAAASAEPVRAYLAGRGLAQSTIDAFGLGHATESWDQLASFARSRKFEEEVLEKSGLFIRTERGWVDRFRGRLMVPIHDRTARVVAFGGRDLTDASEAKYLNSPETPLYRKGEILYGLAKTREAIRAAKTAIVVEGYMDFLMLFQSGLENVVATSGTALTEAHGGELRKQTDATVLAYDGDAAGRRAAIRGGYALLRAGLQTTVAAVPEGLDPDSWVRQDGAAAVREELGRSGSVVEFHVRHTDLDLSSPASRSQIAREIMTEVSALRDPFLRNALRKQTAVALAVSEDELSGMVTQQRVATEVKGDSRRTVADIPMARAEAELIRLMGLNDPPVHRLLACHLNPNGFDHPILRQLAVGFAEASARGEEFRPAAALERLGSQEERAVASRVLMEGVPHKNSLEVAADCLVALERTSLEKRLAAGRSRLKEAEEQGGDAGESLTEVMRLQEELQELEVRRKAFLVPN